MGAKIRKPVKVSRVKLPGRPGTSSFLSAGFLLLFRSAKEIRVMYIHAGTTQIPMDQDKAVRLLLRQLRDIQSQADKILKGEDSNEAIETFSRYSSELKLYISKNVASEETKSLLNELPEINYSRSEIKLWQYFILSSWWVSVYKDYQARNKTIQEINLVKGKYATLELLVKGWVD